MELKAVLHRGCTPEVRDLLESEEFNKRIRKNVLSHLGAQDFGPAEFFIQGCDEAVGAGPMCEVCLTKVSVTEGRSTKNFKEALLALEQVYADVLRPHFTSEEPIQLLVSVVLDRKPFGCDSALLERPAVYICTAPPPADVGC